MKKKNSRNTKGKIVSAAWQLFYRQGYDDTTIDEIVEASGTSRGSFYHYFEGKDALLSSLSYLFDEKYEELTETMDMSLSPIDKLIFLNQELFGMIENTVSVDLLCQLKLFLRLFLIPYLCLQSRNLLLQLLPLLLDFDALFQRCFASSSLS